LIQREGERREKILLIIMNEQGTLPGLRAPRKRTLRAVRNDCLCGLATWKGIEIHSWEEKSDWVSLEAFVEGIPELICFLSRPSKHKGSVR
jgi:hypothetical protein